LFTGGPVNAASEETSISETEGESEKETPEKSDSSAGLAYISAALSTGLACIGAGIAVAITGSAALGAISEDPKLLGKTLIFVGLSEGIAIYGLIISIMILNKV
jgi:F0F1-type ATP synthase membrane subunit c/vacuolar-type H+-ATPase subunit K